MGEEPTCITVLSQLLHWPISVAQGRLQRVKICISMALFQTFRVNVVVALLHPLFTEQQFSYKTFPNSWQIKKET